MKENNNIDNLFKEGVKQEFPFDENLWAAMEGQLPLAPAKRSLWHFNLNSVILGVVLFIYASIQTDTARSTKAYSQTINNISSSNSILTAAVVNSDQTAYKEEFIAVTNQTDYSKNVVTETNNLTTKSSLDNGEDANIKVQEKSIVEVNRKAKIERNKTGIPNTVRSTANNIDISAKSSIVKTAKVSSVAPSNNKPDLAKANSSSLITQTVEPTTLSATTNMSLNHDMRLTTRKESNAILNEDLPPLTSMLSAGFNYGLRDLASPKKQDNKQRILPKKKQYYVEFVASRSFDLEKTVKSTNSQFVDLKKQSETSLHSVNLGINALTYYKFLTFGVGLHYNRFYENVNYTINKEANTVDISYDTNYVIVSDNFNSNGTPVVLIREELTEIRTPRTIIVEDQLRVQNEFKRIRIPLSIGYEKAFGSWSAGLSTSFVINYLFQQNGVYIKEDLNSIYDFNEGEEFYLLVFGHQASAGIGYSLNEFIAIGARYNYEYDLNSFTKDYSSKFQNQNLGLWLRIRPR